MNKNVIHEWADHYDTPHRLVTVGSGVEEQMQNEQGDWHVATKRHSDAVTELGKAIERIKELEAKTAWQPIETAPKRIPILIYDQEQSRSYTGCWLPGVDKWVEESQYKELHSPTHWMPLPSAPKKEETR